MAASSAEVLQVVAGVWPDLTDILGDDGAALVVEEVLAGRDPLNLYRSAPGGAKFDLVAIIAAVAAAAEIVQFGFACYDRFKREGKPSQEKLREALVERAEGEHVPVEVTEKLEDVAQRVASSEHL